MTWLLRRVAVTGSTSDDALALARAGAPHGTVVWAEAQTAGRGRQGRSWASQPSGNIYLSVVLRPQLAVQQAPPLTLAAGVAICDAVNDLGCRASIKWPNDVLIQGRKVAGILTESSTRGARLEAVVIGIGVNVNQTAFPPELEPIATSLALCQGRAVDVEAFGAALLAGLERWIDLYLAEGPAPVVRAWKQLTSTLGKRVRASDLPGGPVGLARDLDDEGALVLELDDGRLVRLRAGEITMEPS